VGKSTYYRHSACFWNFEGRWILDTSFFLTSLYPEELEDLGDDDIALGRRLEDLLNNYRVNFHRTSWFQGPGVFHNIEKFYICPRDKVELWITLPGAGVSGSNIQVRCPILCFILIVCSPRTCWIERTYISDWRLQHFFYTKLWTSVCPSVFGTELSCAAVQVCFGFSYICVTNRGLNQKFNHPIFDIFWSLTRKNDLCDKPGIKLMGVSTDTSKCGPSAMSPSPKIF